MTCRVFNEGDPEPKDHPNVVDAQGREWTWEGNDPYEDDYGWCAAFLERSPNGPYWTRPVDFEWDDLLAEHGPLREAA